jgi:hypothetical protein
VIDKQVYCEYKLDLIVTDSDKLYMSSAFANLERESITYIGRNLVRLSDSLFFAPQSDSEKKKNAIRKSSARNDQIRGLFGSPP